jgi:hypothetical protein
LRKKRVKEKRRTPVALLTVFVATRLFAIDLFVIPHHNCRSKEWVLLKSILCKQRLFELCGLSHTGANRAEDSVGRVTLQMGSAFLEENSVIRVQRGDFAKARVPDIQTKGRRKDKFMLCKNLPMFALDRVLACPEP